MAKSRPKSSKTPAPRAIKRKRSPAKAETPSRPESKQARLIAMLRAPEGATIAKITKSFGWQPHTVRGVLSGALKKKLGLTIKSDKTEDGERVYRIA